MAATKKSKTKKAVDMTLSIGDRVRVVSATIFDNRGNLSDLLATGTITKVNPMPGWDYEVTFNGELSLDGRDKIKSRLYNKHQISKAFKDLTAPDRMEDEISEAFYRVSDAIRRYNGAVGHIEDINNRMQRCRKPEDIADLHCDRLDYLERIPVLEQEVKDAKKHLAVTIRLLIAGDLDDTASV